MLLADEYMLYSFSLDLEEAMLDTGKSLSITKLKLCFWEYLQTYIKSNKMRNVHAKSLMYFEVHLFIWKCRL